MTDASGSDTPGSGGQPGDGRPEDAASGTDERQRAVGAALRHARQAAGYDLRPFAKLVAFDPGYLSKIETGRHIATMRVVTAYDDHLHRGGALRDAALHAGISPAGPARRPPRTDATPTPHHPPSTLPPTVPVIGRVQEQHTLHQLLTARTRDTPAPHTPVLLISGPPASGTSTLAIAAAHRARADYPDGVLYVDLAGISGPPDHARDPTAVLAVLLAALHVTPIGATRAQRTHQYHTALARGTDGQPRRVLLVLDNARDADQVRPLLPGVAATGTTVLITSHRTLPELHCVEKLHVPVPPLTPARSTALLHATLAAHGHPAAHRDDLLTVLVEPLAGHPLAIRSLAEWMLHSQHDAPDQDLLDDAASLTDTFLAPVYDRLTRALRTVSPAAATLFHQFGVWRADRVPVTRAALAALAGRTVKDTVPLIFELVHSHLLREHAGRFAMTGVAARYAATANERSPAEHDAAARRICSWYLHTAAAADAELRPWHTEPYTRKAPGVTIRPFRNAPEAHEWLQAERDSLLETSHLTARTRQWMECVQLAIALRGFLEHGPTDRELWRATHMNAYTAALEQRNRYGLAVVATYLAEGLRRECRPGPRPATATVTEARHMADVAVHQWHMLIRTPASVPSFYRDYYGGTDAIHRVLVRGHAAALRALALLRRDHGYLTGARQAADDSLALLGPDDHAERAITLAAIADILRRTPRIGHLHEAEQRLHTAATHLTQFGGTYSLTSWIHSILAEVHHTWAKNHNAPTHIPLARDAARTSAVAARRSGNRYALARRLERYAFMATAAGDSDAAHEALTQSLTVFDAIADHDGAARVREHLAADARLRERHSDAPRVIQDSDTTHHAETLAANPYRLPDHDPMPGPASALDPLSSTPLGTGDLSHRHRAQC